MTFVNLICLVVCSGLIVSGIYEGHTISIVVNSAAVVANFVAVMGRVK